MGLSVVESADCSGYGSGQTRVMVINPLGQMNGPFRVPHHPHNYLGLEQAGRTGRNRSLDACEGG